jgi:hypothetical protein
VTESDIHIEYKLQLRNVGATIASNVRYFGYVWASRFEPFEDIKYWRRAWEDLPTQKDDNAILPNETIDHTQVRVIPFDAIPWSSDGNNRCSIILHTAVFYDIESHGEVMERRKIFRAYRIGISHSDLMHRLLVFEDDLALGDHITILTLAGDTIAT